LLRAQEQQRSAQISNRLGTAAVKATPAALIGGGTGEQGTTSVADAVRAAADLPPATVGPLSLRIAAAKGDPSAEFEVGSRLAEGKGTTQNFKEAHRWYQRSATQGFAQAQYRLGTLFERGLGVKADVARARVWYERAAEQGNVKAMHNLAVLSAGGGKSAPDYDMAAKWFRSAAEHGLADSQFNLAVLHENGLGVAQDQKLAYKWFLLAAQSGDKQALRRRDEIKAKLEQGEAELVEREAAAWVAKRPDALANDARAAGEAWKQRQSVEPSSG
jgi:localization factor PodJL